MKTNSNIDKNIDLSNVKIGETKVKFANPTFTKSLFNKLSFPTNPIIFLDVKINENQGKLINDDGIAHRLYFELFENKLPKTCENFRVFCTGEKLNPITKKPYGYKNTSFHRLIKSFILQGGDFISYDGSGSTSIYDTKHFDDEGFYFSHSDIGYLSMANSGKNTNGCQFFITLDKCDWLDKQHVVFGKAIDEYTIEILKVINDIPSTFDEDMPLQEIKIVNCGQM